MSDRLPPVTRRRIAAASLVLLVPVLAACSSSEYQTDQVYQPGVGVNERSGTVDVLGAVVVRTSEGEGSHVHGVSAVTTVEAALAAVHGMAERATQPLHVRSLQEYHRG